MKNKKKLNRFETLEVCVFSMKTLHHSQKGSLYPFGHCHTVHPINKTFTEIRSQTICLCMSTKTIDLKLLNHFEFRCI